MLILALGDPNGKHEYYKKLWELEKLGEKSKIEINLKFPNRQASENMRIQISDLKSLIDNDFYRNLSTNDPLGIIAIHFKNIVDNYCNWFTKDYSQKNDQKRIGTEYSILEIAMICAITNRHITKQNQDEIAMEFGKAKGGSLYQDYLSMQTSVKRTHIDPDQPRKVKAQIKRYNNILNHLTIEEHRVTALSELNKLQMLET